MCFEDEKKKEVTNYFEREIDDAVNYVFRHFQRIYQIESGDEPFDTRIRELQKELAEECTRVLEFQLPYDEDKNPYDYAVDTMPDELSKESAWLAPTTKVGAARKEFLRLVQGNYGSGPVKIAAFEFAAVIRDVIPEPEDSWFKWVDDVVRYYEEYK
ncbi:MAG: hypothetical protein IKQ22_00770 [Clostridia bacterium]|nr:hypothetical protein [Clostridia bacterium]